MNKNDKKPIYHVTLNTGSCAYYFTFKQDPYLRFSSAWVRVGSCGSVGFPNDLKQKHQQDLWERFFDLLQDSKIEVSGPIFL